MRLGRVTPSGLRPRMLVPAPLRRAVWDRRRAARERRWRRFPGHMHLHAAGEVAITFDDGPDEDATPAVLDALDQVGARATFFVLGEQLLRFPDLGREIAGRGHELALHGFEHARQDRISAAQSREDLVRGIDLVASVTGSPARWYRPPYGRMSQGSFLACRELGLEVVYWSSWGQDWERLKSDAIAAFACRDLDGGGIVVLHDSARYGRRPSALPTAQALRAIGDCARERGLEPVTLSAGLGGGASPAPSPPC